ncbi:MAG: ATP-binding protein [Bacteroidota bacterium]
MLRFLLFATILLGYCSGLTAQEAIRDSLLKKLDLELPFEDQMQRLANFCDGDKACFQEQIDWLSSSPHAAYLSYLYRSISVIARRSGETDYSRKMIDLALASCPAEDQLLKGYLYNDLSTLFWRYLGQMDSSSSYAFKALETFGDTYRFDQHQPYMQLGQIKERLNLYEEALDNYQVAFQCAELKPGNRFAYGYTLYHVLGMALQLGKTEVFSSYIGRYRDFMQNAGSINNRHDAMLNLLIDNEESIQQLERILADSNYIDQGNFLQGSTIGSLEFSHRLVAQALIERGQYQQAEFHLRKSLQILQDNNVPVFQEEAYRLLTQLGRKSQQAELLIEGLENYNRLRDSISSAKYRERISEWEVRYATEKTEAELARAELAEAQTRRQRDSLLLGTGLLTFLVLGVIWRLRLLRRQRAFERQLQTQRIQQLQRENDLNALRAMIDGQETERKRVAKDLHDGLGGLLATVKALLSSRQAQPKAVQMVDRASTEVRRIAHNLMPKKLSLAGLAAALEDLSAQLNIQGYTVELELSPGLNDHLEISQQHTLLRIIQELCQNIVKHADAQSILIQLLLNEEELLLIVEDDGKGFNLEYVKSKDGGLGLSSIENRVTFLQGELLFDSRPGSGTTATINVPLPARNYDRDTPHSL